LSFPLRYVLRIEALPIKYRGRAHRMAVRYEDDQIASVLTRLGYRTGTDKRWNQTRVTTTRRRYSIPDPKPTALDSELLSMGAAAKYCGVSESTIKRLVSSGVLKREQVVPYAPWEIRRSDLDSPEIRIIIERLRRTGKLALEGDRSQDQPRLFTENKGVNNAR